MGFMSSNNEMPAVIRGIVTLVTAGSITYDDSTERILSVKLVAVGRGKVNRVRSVKGGLLVADGWQPMFDNIPEASYKHQLYVRQTQRKQLDFFFRVLTFMAGPPAAGGRLG